MAQKQILLGARLATPPTSTVAPESRPEPLYNNFKVVNFNYQ